MATGQFGNLPIPWRDDVLAAIGAVAKAGDTMTGPLAVTGGGIETSGPIQAVSTASSRISLGAVNGLPQLRMVAAMGAADEKVHDIHPSANGIRFRLVNDANTAAHNWLTVTRTGAAASSAAFGGPVVAPTLTGIAAGAASVNARSGAAGNWAAFSIGRTTLEGYWGVSGGASHIFYGDVAGDVGLKAEAGTLRLGIGPTAHLAVDGSGTLALTALRAVGGVGVAAPATSMVRMGTSGSSPSWQAVVAAAPLDQKLWEIVAFNSSLAFRTVNDAYSFALPWMQVDRSGVNAVGITLQTSAGSINLLPGGDVGIGSNASAYAATGRRVMNIAGATDSLLSLNGATYLWHDAVGKKAELAATGTNRLSLVAGGAERIGVSTTGAVTVAGSLAATAPNASALATRSGASNAYAGISLGRMAGEAILGISGGNTQVANGDVAGDLTLRNDSGRILLALGTFPAVVVSASGVATNLPFSLAKYSMSTAAAASAFNGCLIEITDAAGGPKVCRSNGSAWLILNTQTPVT